MEDWQKDNRRNVVMVDIDALVPAEHLLRKVEKVMDYGWLYERLSPYYCHDNGRNGSDPVVPVKMVLLQHLYGIASLRQTHQRICDTLSYQWFLGYGLLDDIPRFATVSYGTGQPGAGQGALVRALMDIQRLRYFEEIVRNKSFTRAAEQLFIPQPMLTRVIKQLEQELNTKLREFLSAYFARAGPTPSGCNRPEIYAPGHCVAVPQMV